MGDSFSTVWDAGRKHQYSWEITSVQWAESFSTVDGIQYIGRITPVHVGDNISIVGKEF